MTFDIGQAFTFAFEEKIWRSRFFGLVLLSFIPGMNLIAWTGYSISVARTLALQEESRLPMWTDWSDILVRGLLAIVAAILYFLPALVISGCFGLISLILGERAQGSFIAIRFCAYSISIVYILLASLLLNAAHARFARTDKFNLSYLKLGARISEVRKNTSRLVTLTAFQLAIAGIGIGVLFVGIVILLVAINLIVRLGVVVALIMIPIMLLLLFLQAAAVSLAYLAVGYALGMFAVQLPANADIDSDANNEADLNSWNRDYQTSTTASGIKRDPKRVPAR